MKTDTPTPITLSTTSDAARELRVSAGTVREFADAGLLPVAAKTTRGDRLFQPEAIEALRRARAAKQGRR